MTYKSLRKSQRLRPFFNAAIAGDLSRFENLVRIRGMVSKEREFAQAIRHRFTPPTPCSSFVSKLNAMYEEYWMNALLRTSRLVKLENKLFGSIVDLLNSEGLRLRTQDKTKIEKRLEHHLLHTYGLHSLLGTVRPLRELEIWKENNEGVFRVKIPETTVDVRVNFISKFRAKGWLAFATHNVYAVGGWAKADGLVCNSALYDQNSETFRVSYLAHEAQHFHDYKVFPKLLQHDLEYRAKLAELACIKRTKNQTLHKFTELAKFGKQSPHSHANYFVMKDMKRLLNIKSKTINWAQVGYREINDAARENLNLHSNRLNTKGAKITTGVIHLETKS